MLQAILSNRLNNFQTPRNVKNGLVAVITLLALATLTTGLLAKYKIGPFDYFKSHVTKKMILSGTLALSIMTIFILKCLYTRFCIPRDKEKVFSPTIISSNQTQEVVNEQSDLEEETIRPVKDIEQTLLDDMTQCHQDECLKGLLVEDDALIAAFVKKMLVDYPDYKEIIQDKIFYSALVRLYSNPSRWTDLNDFLCNANRYCPDHLNMRKIFFLFQKYNHFQKYLEETIQGNTSSFLFHNILLLKVGRDALIENSKALNSSSSKRGKNIIPYTNKEELHDYLVTWYDDSSKWTGLNYFLIKTYEAYPNDLDLLDIFSLFQTRENFQEYVQQIIFDCEDSRGYILLDEIARLQIGRNILVNLIKVKNFLNKEVVLNELIIMSKEKFQIYLLNWYDDFSKEQNLNDFIDKAYRYCSDHPNMTDVFPLFQQKEEFDQYVERIICNYRDSGNGEALFKKIICLEMGRNVLVKCVQNLFEKTSNDCIGDFEMMRSAWNIQEKHKRKIVEENFHIYHRLLPYVDLSNMNMNYTNQAFFLLDHQNCFYRCERGQYLHKPYSYDNKEIFYRSFIELIAIQPTLSREHLSFIIKTLAEKNATFCLFAILQQNAKAVDVILHSETLWQCAMRDVIKKHCPKLTEKAKEIYNDTLATLCAALPAHKEPNKIVMAYLGYATSPIYS